DVPRGIRPRQSVRRSGADDDSGLRLPPGAALLRDPPRRAGCARTPLTPRLVVDGAQIRFADRARADDRHGGEASFPVCALEPSANEIDLPALEAPDAELRG